MFCISVFKLHHISLFFNNNYYTMDSKKEKIDTFFSKILRNIWGWYVKILTIPYRGRWVVWKMPKTPLRNVKMAPYLLCTTLNWSCVASTSLAMLMPSLNQVILGLGFPSKLHRSRIFSLGFTKNRESPWKWWTVGGFAANQNKKLLIQYFDHAGVSSLGVPGVPWQISWPHLNQGRQNRPT